MKKTILMIGIALLAIGNLYAQNRVSGHYRQNGTYVQPHYRTSPDNNMYNNYSTKGNYNPYTGAQGTVNPYSSRSSSSGNMYNNNGFGWMNNDD